VVQYAINFCCGIPGVLRASVLKIALPSRFHDRHIRIHHHVAGSREFLDFRAPGAMIEVRMADQQDFHIAEVKAEFFDAGLNLWNRLLQIAVDQNVPLRCGDQHSRESFAADIVDVSGHLVRRKRLGPLRWVLCDQGYSSKQDEHARQKRRRQHFATWIHFRSLRTTGLRPPRFYPKPQAARPPRVVAKGNGRKKWFLFLTSRACQTASLTFLQCFDVRHDIADALLHHRIDLFAGRRTRLLDYHPLYFCFLIGGSLRETEASAASNVSSTITPFFGINCSLYSGTHSRRIVLIPQRFFLWRNIATRKNEGCDGWHLADTA